MKRSDKIPKAVRLTAKLLRPAEDGDWMFVMLPQEAGAGLPSRGMVAVEGTLNGRAFEGMLEPDGRMGHWMKVERPLAESAGAVAGDEVALEIAPRAEEPEPVAPADFSDALAAKPDARAVWEDITPAARRDWIQWVVSPKKPETRARRIENGCSMLAGGKRRPCCFDRSGAYSKSLGAPRAAD